MYKNTLKRALIVAVFMLTIFLPFSTITHSGCTIKHDIDTVYTSAVFRCFVYEYVQMASLMSDPVADLEASNVTIKWGNNNHNFSKKSVRLGPSIYFEDSLSLTCGDTCTIILSSNLGECRGMCVIPDTLRIIRPSDEDTLESPGDIIAIWNKPRNATFYLIQYGFYAYDSSGRWIRNVYADTIGIDTTFTIPESFYNVPGAAFYRSYLYVWPYNGPYISSGAFSNMEGSIRGFLFGGGWLGNVIFHVGKPTKNAEYMTLPLPSDFEPEKAVLKRLRILVK